MVEGSPFLSRLNVHVFWNRAYLGNARCFSASSGTYGYLESRLQSQRVRTILTIQEGSIVFFVC